MRILITNDDGINAPGLAVLAEIAQELAGAEGEVWTVAPAFEQSGVGHAISYTHPTLFAQLGQRSFAAEGSPADCVLAAIHEVFQGQKPDLILSGVNRGNNAGENVLYSGTIGGAMEGALQGVPSIALSQYMGPETRLLEDPFAAARVHGAATIRRLLDRGLWDDVPYRLFYNINFPPCAAADVKGVRVAPQGFRPGPGFSTEPHISPSGKRFLWVRGGEQGPAEPGSDVTLNLEGFVTVTPLRCDLTAHDRLRELEAAFA
ncbi:5'/3'-nucleotidase SurE [Falsirhodobacter sp. 20TX0035]|uniref:5'/3'-nucleotidase SurE n=1 Tax=Falsirhodobacter sp. 20TX0035 TaxID=3022019 RepID=UPI00232B42EE|nr:5'/3'-nucleotidase SurE [Falsirhodobacter sp. 20TX0035]MDB6454341.1 5'/3'-nucleotidase SurE [Falsirhodobacter sp. 20TX0035]